MFLSVSNNKDHMLIADVDIRFAGEPEKVKSPVSINSFQGI